MSCRVEEIVKCQCGDISHAVQFAFFDDPGEDPPFQKEMYITVILDNRHNFFKRLYYGLRYILFGDVSKYGITNEAVLTPQEVAKVKHMCDLFLHK